MQFRLVAEAMYRWALGFRLRVPGSGLRISDLELRIWDSASALITVPQIEGGSKRDAYFDKSPVIRTRIIANLGNPLLRVQGLG